MDQPTRCPRCGAEHSEPRGDGLCRRCVLEAAFRSAETPGGDADSRADLEITGDMIGPYRLLEKLGEGGMGVVHLAERTGAMRGNVALKLVKWGMDTKQVLARFETERTALSLMDHPNIAKVLDGGATENGRPYFVMEYVKGESITRYCDRQRVRTRERLELFVDVCEGVQHAHQKGIIHRDLKPSNVLVQVHGGRVVPKIIDFGVAKATAHRLTERTLHTQLGQPLGTPEYMSPEQAEMTSLDVDTRTDVYSLGVLLYELLIGERPFELRKGGEASHDEIRRRIREEEPAKPSARLSTLEPDSSAEMARKRRTDVGALRRRLRGDLDWIVLKALEKDRTRRYASATELAEDVRRHLRDEPVAAGPPSTAYQMKKFARRHRAGVAATAAVGVLLIGFAVTMAVQARRIASERDRANAEAERAGREAATARRVVDFMVEMFELSDRGEAYARTVTARELLDRGAERVERELSRDPLIQARLMDTMGRVYDRLGLYDQAEDLLQKAFDTRTRNLGSSDPAVAASLASLGHLRLYQGRSDEALELLRRSLEIREATLGPDHPDTAWSVYWIALAQTNRGEFDEGVALLQRALRIFEREYGRYSRPVAWCFNDLGRLHNYAGRPDEAITFHSQALEIKRRVLGDDHEDTARTMGNLGETLVRLGRYDEALPLLEEGIGVTAKDLGPRHPVMVVALINLGELYHKMGRFQEAEARYSQAVSAWESQSGIPDYAPYDFMASLLADMGRLDEAEPYYLRAIEIGNTHFYPERLAGVLEGYAALLRKTGREDEAVALEERARKAREEAGAD